MPFLNKGNIGNSGLYKSITPPSNRNILWQDTSVIPNVIKFYNNETSQWEPVGGSGGSGGTVTINGKTGSNITLNSSDIGAVKNESNTVPLLQAGTLSSRPVSMTNGGFYFATDTKEIYRYNGTSYDLFGGTNTIDWTNVINKQLATITTDGLMSSIDKQNLNQLLNDINNKAEKNDLGDKSDLLTTNKSSFVEAVNELKINIDSKTDEKVKSSATDIAGYLDSKVDGVTTQIVGEKIVAKTLDGMTVGVLEINYLSGLTGNVQQQINSIVNGVQFKGEFATYADMTSTLTTPEQSWWVFISADETKGNARTQYIFNESSWLYAGGVTSVNDATDTVKGVLKIAGDLTGTADSPIIKNDAITVNKIASNVDMSSKNFKATDSNKLGGVNASDYALKTELNNKMPILSTFTTGNIPKIKADGTVEDSGKSVDDLSVKYDTGNFTTTYTYNVNGKIIKEELTGDVTRTVDYEYYTFADGANKEGKIKREIITENGKTTTSVYDYDSNGRMLPVVTTTV